MSTEKIYKVFVSSTYDDLREERAAVQKALLQLNCLPVGMELFPATDDETWIFIKSQIDDCDYYVVVVAGRYGSLDTDGLSFTEKEYDYAVSQGKPTIGFVHGDPGLIAANKTDSTEPEKSKLVAFLKKIKHKLVRQYSDSHTLALEVTLSFVQLRRDHPAIGYVRSNEAVDFRRYAELLEENNSLRERLKLTEQDTQLFPTSERTIDLLIRPERRITCTVAAAFEAIAEAILQGTEEQGVLTEAARRLAGTGYRVDVQTPFNDESVKILRRELLLYDLIEISTEDRSNYSSVAGTYTKTRDVWKLTPYGRRQLKVLTNAM